MTRDLSELDREVAAARVVDGIRQDVALRLAAREGRRRRRARTSWPRTLGLILTAAIAALLTWMARRRR